MKPLFAAFVPFTLVLQGCSTVVPVPLPQPVPPPALLQACAPLSTTNKKETSTLSDLMKVVSNNYASHHQCAAKVDGWIAWYKENSKLVETSGGK